jgi:AraC-like DNA-binding protein
MSTEVDEVVAWRADGAEHAIWMHGRTTGYAVDPVGEHVIGVATAAGYRLRRGRHRYIVRAGELVVLDPEVAHSGRPLEREPWSAKLLALELADIGGDGGPLSRPTSTPVVHDPSLTRRFLALHRASAAGGHVLELEVMLAAFLDDLFGAPGPARRDHTCVARAAAYLHDNLTSKVTLDQLAQAAGASKFHLVREFRAVAGVPPHAYQIGLRVRLARRLLEHGLSVAEAAARSGFVDQSHLHRHFRSRLGITPGRYRRAFGDGAVADDVRVMAGASGDGASSNARARAATR